MRFISTSQYMARGAIQIEKGLSLPGFRQIGGTEMHYEAALENACWPNGSCSAVPDAMTMSMGSSTARLDPGSH